MKKFRDYLKENEVVTEKIKFSDYKRMEGLVVEKDIKVLRDVTKSMKSELKSEGFEDREIFEFIIECFRKANFYNIY